MKKKIAFVSSFALATLLVVGQFAYANQSNSEMDMNMNGNKMMNSDEMTGMMKSLSSPEGQKMVKACNDFMN
ncbi:hypothetical protein B9K06_12590 [Bacillus sp. OG2]|nr:hypothetical protein B9K06_12590 [Bacillus sp. OG2]